MSSRASCCGLSRATAVMPWTKSKTLSGGRPSSASTASMIRPVSAARSRACAGSRSGRRRSGQRPARASRPDHVDERHRRGVGEGQQRRGGLVREARRGVLRMPDGDLLEVLDAPEIAVLADRPQVEARHPEGLRADLGVPAVEATEVEVGRAVRQLAPPRSG